MNFNSKTASVFIPSGLAEDAEIARTTHMAISAHQDDIEIMAYDGILKCFGAPDKSFVGVVTTNGAGSPRSGIYADYTDERMQAVRAQEQKTAGLIGGYGAVVLLDYPSSAVKDPSGTDVINDFKTLLLTAKPHTVYTHNLADKHHTHVGVAYKVVQAIRGLDKKDRPEFLYGCEVWRDVDWISDERKVVFDVSGREHLAAALLGVFDSQIAGGKRYDLATAGRRLANATYAASHGVDTSDAVINAMNLTPLIKDDSLDIEQYVTSFIDEFKSSVTEKLKTLSSR